MVWRPKSIMAGFLVRGEFGPSIKVMISLRTNKDLHCVYTEVNTMLTAGRTVTFKMLI